LSDHEAPRVFISYARDSPEHEDRVLAFANLLREQVGLDVHLDRWYENKRRDWTAWTIEQMDAADFIVAVASPGYKRSADGTALPHEGWRTELDAARIRDYLSRNLRAWTEQLLPVVFPGQSVDDIPTFFNPYSTTRFHVEEFTRAGVSELLSAITGHGRYPLPERGDWQHGSDSAPFSRVLVAKDLRWLACNPEIRSGSARIDGVRYEDSLVLRPASRTAETLGFVEVDLGAAYRRLTAVAGVLDDAIEPFQVGHFQIYLDGIPQQESRVALGKPGMFEVDVTGVLRMRLEMYRPGATGSALSTAPRRSRRLPELAWGNPALS
jgi:hypothetical protein